MSTAEAKYETAQERMNAILEGFRGEVRAALEGLRKDQEKLRGDFTTAQEKLRADMESRHSSSLRWTFMLVIGAVTLVISAVAGFNLYGAGVG